MSTPARVLLLALSSVALVGAITGCGPGTNAGDLGRSDLTHGKTDLGPSADLRVHEPKDLAIADDLAMSDDGATSDDAGTEDLAAADLAIADAGKPDMRRLRDMTAPVVDLAGADLAPLPDLRTIVDLAGADLALGCHPIINELQTGSAANATEEFVELYNPCPMSIALGTWKLAYRSAGNNSGGGDVTLVTIGNTQIAAGGYVFFCGATFADPNCAGMYNGGLASKGGAVGLRNDVGVVVDSVAYDALTAPNDFTRGTPAPNPPTVAAPGNSISRLPNGADTANNQADFKVSTKPTPGAANQ